LEKFHIVPLIFIFFSLSIWLAKCQQKFDLLNKFRKNKIDPIKSLYYPLWGGVGGVCGSLPNKDTHTSQCWVDALNV
jgi:hypothetical protein